MSAVVNNFILPFPISNYFMFLYHFDKNMDAGNEKIHLTEALIHEIMDNLRC